MTAELNDMQRTALLRLAEIAPTRRVGIVSTPSFGHASTARALERRGLLRGRTFPTEGYQLTDAGRETAEKLRCELNENCTACSDPLEEHCPECGGCDCVNLACLPGTAASP